MPRETKERQTYAPNTRKASSGLARRVQSFAQRFHLIIQVAHHRALCELWVFLKKSVHDLVMLAHRIIEAVGQTERKNPRFLNFLTQLIDEPVETLVTRDFRDETVEAAVGLEVPG